VDKRVLNEDRDTAKSASNKTRSRSRRQTEREELYYRRPMVRIDNRTVSRLIREGVDPSVARVDLELIKLDLEVTSKWSKLRCGIAELEYKRLLTLILWNRDLPHPIVPTRLADEIWHKHILDTRAYHSDMKELFGEYLHHFPFLGFGSEESKKLKDKAFLMTCQLYEKTFGEPFTHNAKKLRFEKKNDIEK